MSKLAMIQPILYPLTNEFTYKNEANIFKGGKISLKEEKTTKIEN